jgi:uncharacterized protein (DUF983 family)
MNDTAITPPARMSFALAALRGLTGRCPNCGKGHLFSSYLKQVLNCANCNDALGHIRADDGPAWLTIVIVGHILAPVMLFVVPAALWPEWVTLMFLPLLALALALLILPRAKGVFIAAIWRTGCIGSEKV